MNTKTTFIMSHCSMLMRQSRVGGITSGPARRDIRRIYHLVIIQSYIILVSSSDRNENDSIRVHLTGIFSAMYADAGASFCKASKLKEGEKPGQWHQQLHQRACISILIHYALWRGVPRYGCAKSERFVR